MAPLKRYQNNLNAHANGFLSTLQREEQKPTSHAWVKEFKDGNSRSQISENIFIQLQGNGESLFGNSNENWMNVLENPPTIAKEEIFTKGQVFFPNTNAPSLEKILSKAHLGRAFAHLTILQAKDICSMQKVMSQIIHGDLDEGAFLRARKGQLILTDPNRVFCDLVQNEKDHYPGLLWLMDDNGGDALTIDYKSGNKVANYAGLQKMNYALLLSFIQRVDKLNPHPQILLSDFSPAQARWPEFLKQQELTLPGISGVAKNLLATLFFGLSRVFDPSDSGKNLPAALLSGSEALARFVVERNVHTIKSLRHNAQDERHDDLKSRILQKLHSEAHKPRDIYRALGISAEQCEKLLCDLSEDRLVTTTDGA